MTTTNATMKSKYEFISPARRRVMGIVFLAFAAAIWLFFVRDLQPGIDTTFKMAPGGSKVEMADWIFPSTATLNILALVSAAMGAYQLTRGFGKRMNLILALVAGMFIFSFLSWAAAGGSMNFAGLIRASLLKAVPLTLGALSGILCERSGVVNIAIEGMMLTGAFVGTVIGSLTNMWLGLLAAILAGGILGLVHAVLSIKYKTDQIISGTVINIFAAGLTSYLSAKFFEKYPEINNPGIFGQFEIPLLSKIPFIGPILFDHNIFVYAVYLLLIILTVALFYTKWGLRLRSVGEHPKAADTLGINVFRTRYMAVVLGGMMAGFGGGYFVLGSVGRFDEMMTAGRGFIGLAAMIFGNWNPFGAFGAGLLFGFADALASKLAILKVPIPSEFLLMIPYIATMIVLAGVVGRSKMPAADGQPYEKE
ncbi:MAG: ABC transporter permease [Anaerolineaceae bacterium]|nr:ABC transporter permease [Anaerolineaceae bacterium]